MEKARPPEVLREPYHAGERAVQDRMGVVGDADRVGRILRPTLPPAGRGFLMEQRLAVASSLEASGVVWASLLTGLPGFLQAMDEELLLIEGGMSAADPLLTNLSIRPEIGLLAIDLSTRRRFRVNGRGLVDGGSIFIHVERAYGNCPKYIQPREIVPVSVSGPPAPRWSSALDARQRDWIAHADSFFIASAHPEGGADASHRGGEPGFVRVLGPHAFTFPDYPGNNMFNTLGNIAAEPRVGLLFLDFETGDTLQLTGRASLEWTSELEHADGPSVAVSFEVEAVLESRGAGVRGRPLAPAIGDG